MADDAGGFLSRWSRRKTQVRQGEVPADPPPPAVAAIVQPTAPTIVPAADAGPVEVATPAPPPPTLADVATLGRDSDFTRFVTPGVDSTVKNAALKKLFSDPHFNVMDGLDTYIDDYGKPDPLPMSSLRKMAQAKFLGLFDDDHDRPDPTQAGTEPVRDAPREGPAPDENPDLRLQSNDAAGRQGAEPGPGEDPGRVD